MGACSSTSDTTEVPIHFSSNDIATTNAFIFDTVVNMALQMYVLPYQNLAHTDNARLDWLLSVEKAKKGNGGKRKSDEVASRALAQRAYDECCEALRVDEENSVQGLTKPVQSLCKLNEASKAVEFLTTKSAVFTLTKCPPTSGKKVFVFCRSKLTFMPVFRQSTLETGSSTLGTPARSP